MNAVRLFSLLVYTFGVFVYGAMLALWLAAMGHLGWAGRRSDGTGGRRRDAINGVLLAVSFVWFVLNVATLVLSMTAHGRIEKVDLAIIFVAFAFPPVIMHVSWAEASHGREQPLSRGWWLALWPVYLVCLVIPVWTVNLFFSRPFDAHAMAIANQALSTGLVGVFIVAAFYSMALLSYRRRHQPLASRDGQLRRPMLILFACMIAVFVLVYVIGMLGADTRPSTAVVGDVVELVAKSLPLVFVFVGTYYENRFQFFDIFVKRGTGFIMAIGVLTIWFAIMLPLVAPIATTWAAPWIFAIALVPAVVVIPWLYVIVSRALDRRWLGRRFTPQDALSRFMGTLRSATTEAQLIARAQEGLKEIYGASALVTVVTCGRVLARPRESPAAGTEAGAGAARAGALSAREPVGAQGAPRADQPAFPVQCAEFDRGPDPSRSCSRRPHDRAARRRVPVRAARRGERVGGAR